MTTIGPADVVREVGERLSRGDVEATLALYEPDAAFAARPGETVAGTRAIREALQGFVALHPQMTGEVAKVLETGDTALVVNRWSLHGTAPGGEPVEMGGTSADVLRRQRDGRWLVAIDDPWGGEG